MKKYLAEMVGTMVLVLMGCGSAVFNGGCGTPAQVLMVAVAFGLSVVAMAYTIGGVSGCHINPAITLGCMLSGRMKAGEAYEFYTSQILLDARKEAKVTQAELAERIHVTKSYIARVEKGLVTPSAATFYRIMNALGMKVEVVKPIV